MTDSPDGDVVELRLKAPGWGSYGGILACAVPITAVAVVFWGLAVWSVFGGGNLGIFAEVRGVLIAGVFTLGALIFWGLFALGTATAWRTWRRLRPPGAVMNATGVGYEVRRGPVVIPWQDVECLELWIWHMDPKVEPTSGRIRVRVTPDAALSSDGRIRRIGADRWLLVGGTSNADNVSLDDATHTLKRLSGSRLKIIDRREHRDRTDPG